MVNFRRCLLISESCHTEIMIISFSVFPSLLWLLSCHIWHSVWIYKALNIYPVGATWYSDGATVWFGQSFLFDITQHWEEYASEWPEWSTLCEKVWQLCFESLESPTSSYTFSSIIKDWEVSIAYTYMRSGSVARLFGPLYEAYHWTLSYLPDTWPLFIKLSCIDLVFNKAVYVSLFLVLILTNMLKVIWIVGAIRLL